MSHKISMVAYLRSLGAVLYNETEGGEGGLGLCGERNPMFGKEGPNKGRTFTDEWKGNISKGCLNRSDEWRARQSAAKAGQPWSPARRLAQENRKQRA